MVCCFFWMITAYPKFRGKNKFLKIESEEQFDELIEAVGKKKDEGFSPYQYKNKRMFFVEFYADWLAICNTVHSSLPRVRNYGINTPIGTPLPPSSSYRSTSLTCPSWPKDTMSTSLGSPSSCQLCSLLRMARKWSDSHPSRRITRLIGSLSWITRYC